MHCFVLVVVEGHLPCLLGVVCNILCGFMAALASFEADDYDAADDDTA